jgi:shikimate 5-dehydrogenase
MTGRGSIGDARGEKQLPSMKDKTVLVIGCGSGVARAVALAVSEDGGQVMAEDGLPQRECCPS